MPRLLNLLLIALLLSSAPARSARAQGGEPSRAPILRIETGMHTAAIKRIGVDRAGRFLVTASDDKTARVWELQTGRLLRVLRVPVGDGNEGKLYAAAISPDGNTIAAGGWTGYEWEKQIGVYLFDRESGRLVRRLTGLPNVVNHLAFSPDGALLAATLAARMACACGAPRTGRRRARHGLRRQSYGADFDRAGRLVTSCFDGLLRLYDTRGRCGCCKAGSAGRQAALRGALLTRRAQGRGRATRTAHGLTCSRRRRRLYSARH